MDFVEIAQEYYVFRYALTEYARLLESGRGGTSAYLEHSSFLSPEAVLQSNFGNSDNHCINSLALSRNTLRDLVETQFGMVKNSNGNFVYDSPIETNQFLYKNPANPAFQGTCGLCSCANILRFAGVNATEAQMIAYASTTRNPDTLFQKLCASGYADSRMNGGMSPKSRQCILQKFGIVSGIFALAIEKDGGWRTINVRDGVL